METKNKENVGEEDAAYVFEVESKLQGKKLEDAILLLKNEEKANGVLGEYYRALFEAARKAIYLKVNAREVSPPSNLESTFSELGSLDRLERFLNIDIRGSMLAHYLDENTYKYEMKSLFSLMLLSGFEWWIDNAREASQFGIIELENLKKMVRYGNDEARYTTLMVILLSVANYYDFADKSEEKSRMGKEFIANPGKFIDEEVYKIPFGDTLKNANVRETISEGIYESLKTRNYISGELPSYKELKTLMPEFSEILVNTLIKFKDTEIRIGVLAVASYYTAVIRYLQKNNLLEDAQERIQKEVERIMNDNQVNPHQDASISKSLYEMVKMISNGRIPEAEKKDLEYIR
ncbi:MAG: hypothetical protein ACP5P2_02675 [Candidatus Micrarchaeia archaeon]